MTIIISIHPRHTAAARRSSRLQRAVRRERDSSETFARSSRGYFYREPKSREHTSTPPPPPSPSVIYPADKYTIMLSRRGSKPAGPRRVVIKGLPHSDALTTRASDQIRKARPLPHVEHKIVNIPLVVTKYISRCIYSTGTRSWLTGNENAGERYRPRCLARYAFLN